MVSGRKISLEIIKKVLEEGCFYGDVYEELIVRYCPDDREKAFINNLSLGTIERCITLDCVIDLFSGKPVRKLKPYIRNILRMGIYQIFFMDKVPDNAVVNEAVKLAGEKGYSGLTGFVNGILRNIIRHKENIDLTGADLPYVQRMSIRYSMPEWLVTHFTDEMGENAAEDAFRYFLSDTGITLRIRKGFYDRVDGSEKGRLFEDAVKIKKSGRINDLPGYSEGAFVVQDESSMIPAHLISSYLSNTDMHTDGRQLRVLELCAAPGGKILELADELGDKAVYTACDISENKTALIRENANRLRIAGIDVKVRDALVSYEEEYGCYDVVIADLPCSGLGVIAGKPDIKYNTKPEDLPVLAGIQKKMLNIAADYVRGGGLLVFSTCTINKAENEDNAVHFLNDRSDYEPVDPTEYVPEALHSSINGKFIKVFPGTYDSDGFFVTVFRRN